MELGAQSQSQAVAEAAVEVEANAEAGVDFPFDRSSFVVCLFRLLVYCLFGSCCVALNFSSAVS